MKKFRLSFRRKKEKKEYVNDIEYTEENEDDVSYFRIFGLSQESRHI